MNEHIGFKPVVNQGAQRKYSHSRLAWGYEILLTRSSSWPYTRPKSRLFGEVGVRVVGINRVFQLPLFCLLEQEQASAKRPNRARVSNCLLAARKPVRTLK